MGYIYMTIKIKIISGAIVHASTISCPSKRKLSVKLFNDRPIILFNKLINKNNIRTRDIIYTRQT